MKDAHAYAALPIDELYRWFAAEAEPTSPTWGALCRWVSGTPRLLERLDALPGRKRQPNLFLAALRFHGGPVTGGPALIAWVERNWAAVEATIRTRSTQTNEPGRCAVLAPLLAGLPQPVALLEVGASAGLCLVPDRYRYRLHHTSPDAVVPGASASVDAPVLDCAVAGTPPASPVDLVVAHRAGLDAHPLHADDPDHVRWLRALVWPGEDAREARLAAALAVAAVDPPPIRSGRLPADLPAFLADGLEAARAAGATPVLLHSATLAYLARPERDAIETVIRGAGVRWVSLEGPTIVSSLRGRVGDEARPHFLLALDGEPVAVCSPHGSWVRWLAAGGG